MNTQIPTPPRDVAQLRRRLDMSILLEEAMIDALADGAASLRSMGGREREARQIETLVRTHRVRIIKHRALMGEPGTTI